MDDDLAELLNSLAPFAEEVVTWPNITLRSACYLTDRTPPLNIRAGGSDRRGQGALGSGPEQPTHYAWWQAGIQ